MSSCVDVNSSSSSFPPAEQLCYIPCGFCNIILAVSVPCSSLFDIVTVRCGHCANLWSVNMAAATALQHPHHQSLSPSSSSSSSSTSHSPRHHHQHHHHSQHQHQQDLALLLQAPPSSIIAAPNYRIESAAAFFRSSRGNRGDRVVSAGGGYGGTRARLGEPEQAAAFNRPPEKKRRVPSAYNRFIKEEIQRIKANNPDITHREAFGTAAKNWAHFPHIHFGLMLAENHLQQAKLDQGSAEKHMPTAK